MPEQYLFIIKNRVLWHLKDKHIYYDINFGGYSAFHQMDEVLSYIVGTYIRGWGKGAEL